MREIKFRAFVDGKMINHIHSIEWDIDTYIKWVEGDEMRSEPISGGYLMQFTGLHDKNGKEIYEGDLVAIHKNISLPVIYDDELCSFHLDGSGDHMYGAQYCEVIGNIYEHKYLLEEIK